MGETAALIGLGAAGLGSGLLSSASARSNNKESIAFSRWSQLESQRYNEEMYEKQLADQERLYNSYQSPQAIAQALAQVGVNPASALSQVSGKGMPSVPSASGSSPVGAPHLENEGLALGQGIQSVAGALNSVANAKAQSAQAKETQTLLQEKLNQLILQNNGQELYNAKIAFDKYAAEQKLPHEINDLINDVYLKYYQGKHEEAATGLAKVQMDIASEQYKITKEQAANVGFFISKQLSLLDEDINLSKAKQATEKSSQSANYASASLSREQAKTVHDIRADVVRFNKSLANIKDTEDFISSNTAWNQVQQSLYELNAAKLIPSQIQEAINHARKANDWYEVNELLGIVDEGVKAYGTYYGAKTGKGFVDAQDVRNSIDKDFKDWQKNKANNGSRIYTPRSPYDYIGR